MDDGGGANIGGGTIGGGGGTIPLVRLAGLTAVVCLITGFGTGVDFGSETGLGTDFATGLATGFAAVLVTLGLLTAGFGVGFWGGFIFTATGAGAATGAGSCFGGGVLWALLSIATLSLGKLLPPDLMRCCHCAIRAFVFFRTLLLKFLS